MLKITLYNVVSTNEEFILALYFFSLFNSMPTLNPSVHFAP